MVLIQITFKDSHGKIISQCNTKGDFIGIDVPKNTDRIEIIDPRFPVKKYKDAIK